MPNKARLKKTRKIKEGPKMLNFWATKLGSRDAWVPGVSLDLLVGTMAWLAKVGHFLCILP